MRSTRGENLSDESFITEKKSIEDFLSSFYYESLKSQRASSVGICIIGGFVSIAWTIIWLFFQNKVNRSIGFSFPAGELALAFYGLTFYELFYILLINYCIKHKKHLSKFAIYLNAFLEASFATIVIFLLAAKFPFPIDVFYSPALVAYFIFICLSATKLDFFISLFTGFVAGAGYFLSFIFFTHHFSQETLEVFYSSRFLAFIRGVIMVVSGIAIGFAAHQLRKRVYASLQTQSDKNAIISMFGQYISPVVVESLLHQKSTFPPELRHVCILFLDIRSFTSFAENHTPNEVIDFLNRFFLPLIKITNKHHGFINKFLGDGFLAIFGAPIPDGQDVQHATQAAFAILKKIDEMIQAGEIPPTRCGIGMDAGLVMTGNVGSEERKEYTVIGNAVNIASRLEALNKEFHSQIIVTENVYKFIEKEHPALQSSHQKIRGKEKEVEIFVLA